MSKQNRQSAAKSLNINKIYEKSSTTILKGSTGVKTGKRPIYLKIRNVIYKITNIVNDKFYIGSASFYDKRIGTHISLLRKGEHDNIYLQSAFNKYGESNFRFEIIEAVDCKENLLNREQYWLDITKCYNRAIGYNLCRNAFSRIGQKMSPAARKKIGDFWRGKKFSKKRIMALIERATISQGKKILVYNKDFNLIHEFPSISQASRKLKISIAAISKQCSNLKGNIKPRKYIFRYKDIV